MAKNFSTGLCPGVSSKGIGMFRHYQILAPLLSLFLVRVDLTDLYPLELNVKILKILDGDSLIVGHGNYLFKVRISKVDAPELSQPFLNSKIKSGQKARECLEKSLLNSRDFTLFIYKRDIYGRILGDINHLSFELIKNGCATIYPYAEFKSKKEKFKYLITLKKAKSSKKGIWAYGGFIRPDYWRKKTRRKIQL